MESPENPNKDLYEGRVLTAEEISYRRVDRGHKTKSNNLWMNLQTPSADTDPLAASFLHGAKIADKITNPEDKARFLELSRQLATLAPWTERDYDARWDAIESDEANTVYYEMYTIARRNGISNDDLLR